MPEMPRRRITYKLAAAVMVVALLLGLAISAVGAILDFDREKATQEALIERILVVAKPTAARAVVVIDSNLADEVVDGLLKYDFVGSAMVVDDIGEVMASKSRAMPSGTDESRLASLIAPAVNSYSIPLVADAAAKGYRQAGSLIIAVNPVRLYAPFLDRVIRDIGLAVLEVLVLAAVLGGVFHVLVTRPLNALASAFDQISPVEPGKTLLPVIKAHERDELGVLARSGNRLLTAVQDLLHERERADDRLRAVTEVVSAVSGDSLMDDLVENLVKILGVDSAYIGVFADSAKSRIRTVSFVAHGAKAENFEYAVAGAPCQNVIGNQTCIYNGDVRRKFPDDKGLIRLGVETYVGVPLLDAQEEPVGLIVTLNRARLDNPELIADFVHIFGVRAVAELERVNAQARLKESEERLRAVLDNTTAVIYAKDTSGRYILVNRQFEQLFDVSGDAICGKSDYDLLPKGSSDDVRINDLKILATNAPAEFEEIIPQSDGDHTYISIKFPLRDISGAPYAVCGISTDITARKNAENSLTTQTRNLELAEQMANMGHWRSDAAFTKIYFSDQMYRICGFEAGVPVTWEIWREAIHPQDRELVERTRSTIIEQKQGTELDLRILRPDGQERVLRTTTRVEVGDDGEAVELIGVCQDITERKQAEEALQRAERRYRGIVENATDGIFRSDEAGRLLWANPALARMGGFETTDEMLSAVQDIATDIFVYPDDRKTLHEHLEKHGSVRGFVAQGKRPGTGEHFWFDASVRAERDADGRLVMDGVIRDVTDTKRRNETMRRVEKMQAVGELTGGIAHDFNNLLGILVGNLDMLQEAVGGDPKSGRLVATALRATLRGADLTKQLLGFARQTEEEANPTNLNEVISDLDRLLAGSMTSEIDVQAYLHDDLWLTEISKGDFEDSLINLAINARDAMSGGGTLVIETRNAVVDADTDPDVPAGDYVMVSVSDDGSGMPKHVADRVFEPFFTTKEPGKGTGLGLSLVYGFIQRSKGHIRVHSEPGLGTTIRIFLPRAGCPSIRSADHDPQEMLQGGKEVILAVDDEPDLLHLARGMLERLGYNVLTAGSGQEALDELSRNPRVDVLFTDVVMPGGINGLELANQAKKQKPDLKILLTSGFSEKIGRQGQNRNSRLLKSRLAKPYRIADLAHRIREILDQTNPMSN